MRRLRFALLTSWPLDVRLGSGVVRMLLGLQTGLRQLGHSADIVHPDFLPSSFLNLANLRLQFNRYLRKQDLKRYDVILGSDFDGYALTEEYHNRFFAVNGAVLADVLPFESGQSKRILQHLSRREKQSMEKARKVFVPSQYTAGAVQNIYGIAAEKIQVAALGIDFKRWQEVLRSAADLPKQGPEILCVAKQYKRKGIADLLRAFARVYERMSNVHLTVAGDGPLYRQNRNLAGQLGMGKNVTFTGDITDRARLAAYYKRADVFCLPSYHETFGLVYLEAMASALPVVAYRAAAVPEVVDDDCGILVPPGNISALAKALTNLLTNEHKVKKMSAAGRQKAMQMNWQKTAQKILKGIEG